MCVLNNATTVFIFFFVLHSAVREMILQLNSGVPGAMNTWTFTPSDRIYQMSKTISEISILSEIKQEL